MCTNCRYVYNPFARRNVLVSCGKCEACLQEKACARSNRIRNNVTDGTVTLFVTLTYTNKFVPYVKKSDLYDLYDSCSDDVPVYRNADCRYVFDRFSGNTRLVVDDGLHIVDRFYIEPYLRRKDDVYSLTPLNGLGKDCVGVCYYQDIQDFFKRLRQNLLRHYGISDSFTYYSCSEYGGHTQRPHFHSLIFISRKFETQFRAAIVESWPFADKYRTEKYIELARDAASYVSSYVNCSSRLSTVLSSPCFKQKHSYSKSFGVVLDCFSLRSVMEKIDSGDMRYYSRQFSDGAYTVVSNVIPAYVINRFFPKHKGFGWLSPSQLSCILHAPERISEYLQDYQYRVRVGNKSIPIQVSNKLVNPLYDYSSKEAYRIYISLENAFQRFHKETGLNRFDYAHYYIRAWQVYSSCSLVDSYKECQTLSDFIDFYENIFEYDSSHQIADQYDGALVTVYDSVAPTLSGLRLQIDPNKRSDVINTSERFKSLFYKLDKQKTVTNFCMANAGHNV